jgi:hypothetical protein
VKIGRRGGPTSELAAAADTFEQRQAAEIRDLRIMAARRCRNWTELDPADLVPRERGFLVSASTDDAFVPYRGAALSRSGQLISDAVPLAFYVAGDEVHFLERQSRKWSEIVYERERAAR